MFTQFYDTDFQSFLVFSAKSGLLVQGKLWMGLQTLATGTSRLIRNKAWQIQGRKICQTQQTVSVSGIPMPQVTGEQKSPATCNCPVFL